MSPTSAQTTATSEKVAAAVTLAQRAPGRFGVIALLLATLLPAGAMTGLVSRYGVNVPFWDEWSLLELFKHAHLHQLSFADFFAQNNEHRIVFPKLLFLALESFTGWNTRAEMFTSVFLCALSGLSLQWLVWRTVPGRNVKLLLLGFAINVLIFSPCQHENWLWGYQLAFFLLNLSFVAGTAFLCSHARPLTKFLLAGVAAVVATFSGGSGMLSWLLFVFVFLMRCDGLRLQTVLRWSGAWVLVSIGGMTAYLFDYKKPSWHPPLLASHNVADYGSYLAAFLGAGLGRHHETTSMAAPMWVGGIGFLMFAFLAVCVGLRWQNAGLRRAAAPWLAIGGFTVLSATLACATRIGFGRFQALESRYTTFSVLFVASIIPLAFVVEAFIETPYRRVLKLVNAGSLAASAVLLCSTLPFALRMMRQSYESRFKGHVALTLAKVVDQKEVLETTVHPYLASLKGYAETANELNLLQPPLLSSAEMRVLLAAAETSSARCGIIDGLKRTGDANYVAAGRISGWPADAILLGWRTPDGQTALFSIGYLPWNQSGRPASATNWQATIRRDAVPQLGTAEIEAWAFHLRDATICKLSGSAVVD